MTLQIISVKLILLNFDIFLEPSLSGINLINGLTQYQLMI